MVRTVLAALALSLAGALPGAAEPTAARLFGAKTAGSAQPPQPIGSYAKGCAAGLVPLPETGPTWQAMRLSRNRNWGHPVTIAYLQDLSREAVRIGWRGLYIGDISQPRGGPMTSGHTSHQIGLDADIWMLPPARLNLTRRERETLSSISVRTEDQRGVNANWTAGHHALLRAAASDLRVDRIFVAAAVKIEMCRTARSADTPWLQKIRPMHGHNYHFHVRLKCPHGARHCQTQTPTVAELSGGGNGCDETLTWWVTDYLDPPKPVPQVPRQPRPRHPRDYGMSDLPAECAAVLASD